MPKRPTRTVDNDIRLLANYVRLAERIALRITNEDIEAMPDEDVIFLYGWTDGPGRTITNLSVSCRAELRAREDDRQSPDSMCK